MANAFNLLKTYTRKIGWQAHLFLVLSFVALAFAAEISATAENGPAIVTGVTALAGCLFALAILIIFLRLASGSFKEPTRGLVNGLAAGVLAGVVGGLLGFAGHKGFYLEGFYRDRGYELNRGDDYLVVEDYVFDIDHYDGESRLRRLAICVSYATAVGGVLGVLLDLLHRKINWKKFLGLLVLATALLIGLVGVAVLVSAPETEQGVGIIVSDIQLLFECFLLAFAAISVLRMKWSWRKFLARLLLLVIAVVVARGLTHSIRAQAEGDPEVRLYQLRFQHSHELPSTARERLQTITNLSKSNDNSADSIDTTPFVGMAITVGLFMLWTWGAYALYYKDHPISTWLVRKLAGRGGRRAAAADDLPPAAI